ncbi:MAG: hypothetical protein MSB10_14075 [Clostridiales bacterium]|uniref:hypothetical protein n=1 Tax=Flavonifractor porci TaxID=3133422 RepID=UPI0030ACF3E1|nr:hypothetical protein [Clostridiales bacterium]
MGKLMIVNGSPRAPKSNSKLYIQAFLSAWSGEYEQYSVLQRQHTACLEQLKECSDLLLVFPLYTDGLPTGLMEFLKAMLEQHTAPLTVHVIINCGFREPHQNDVAVDMIRLFCKRGGHKMGGVLRMGCGEAFPNTPFMGMARRKVQKLARSIQKGRPAQLSITLPLTGGMFLRAANKYWLSRGAQFGNSQPQMATMEVEGQ